MARKSSSPSYMPPPPPPPPQSGSKGWIVALLFIVIVIVVFMMTPAGQAATKSIVSGTGTPAATSAVGMGAGVQTTGPAGMAAWGWGLIALVIVLLLAALAWYATKNEEKSRQDRLRDYFSSVGTSASEKMRQGLARGKNALNRVTNRGVRFGPQTLGQAALDPLNRKEAEAGPY